MLPGRFSRHLAILFCLAAAGRIVPLLAQTPGAFTPTASLTTSQSEYVSATLLSNRKVLVAGAGAGDAAQQTLRIPCLSSE